MIDVLYSTWLPWSGMTMIVFTFFPPFFFVFFQKITWIICLWKKKYSSNHMVGCNKYINRIYIEVLFFKFFNVIDCMKPLIENQIFCHTFYGWKFYLFYCKTYFLESWRWLSNISWANIMLRLAHLGRVGPTCLVGSSFMCTLYSYWLEKICRNSLINVFTVI